MDSALEILGFLVATSLGIFLLIALIVLIPGRNGVAETKGPVWLGGPAHSERGVSSSGLVLMDRPAPWAAAPATDWVALAESTEPGGRVGGASAGW